MTHETTYEALQTDLADGVMTVTLDRPDKLNAFDTTMSRELIDFFQRMNAMDEVRAIVVTGAGRAFCAGADISGGCGAFKVWNDGSKPQKREAKDSITLAIFNCLKPIVAAINGAAVGVGITMCLPMDIRMMSTSAKIGFVFKRRGMAMEAGSCWFLPRLVGMQQAQEWVMSAELFGAEEALKGGLVRSVHAPDELLPAARALARKFAAGSSSAVAAAVNRRLMWSMWGAQDPLDAVTLDLQCVGYLAASADAQEGIRSFFEKRAPNFPLRPSKDMPPFGPWA
ncbi:enoyl-CoA hydratase-related protein [Enhydrobacter sp.]|jgi:enoyl-CoA hydratase/carnithine racemase|uniref:enoyl-CoA hydratase-related protein n=1 Tax=Enhydrobacter sp. TaxID=1894999 RepID=UPI002637992B|nr:enoyl-CoA hydratase-related protein [Enhydrobacter sp.]WIM14439.1 MAG: Enoyl-CoA hydratase [Enhydrobacter sp.]